MKTILLLVDKVEPRHLKVTKYLSETLGLKTNVVLGIFSDIIFKIERGTVLCKCGDLNLKNVDLVVFRKTGKKYIQLAGTIALFLGKYNIRYIDKNFEELGAAGNKLYSIVKLALYGLPIVPSLFVSRRNLRKVSQTVIKEFGLPIFAKSLTRQRREGVFVINKVQDIGKLLDEDVSEGFLLQKHIEIEDEYRVVVMGNKVVGLHKEGDRLVKKNRIQVNSVESEEGWLNTLSVSKEITNSAITGTKILNLNISGADICTEKVTGKVYIFEINRGPGLTLDPSISPELPELAKYLTRLL